MSVTLAPGGSMSCAEEVNMGKYVGLFIVGRSLK